MDHVSIVHTTNKLEQSMSESHVQDNFQSPEQSCRIERVIPIQILSNPHTKIKNGHPSSSQDIRRNAADTANNNNTYEDKLNNISFDDNNEGENSNRRSLLVTLEDGTTTETLGTVRDIESEKNYFDNLQNNTIENVRNLNNEISTNQQQHFSPTIHRSSICR